MLKVWLLCSPPRADLIAETQVDQSPSVTWICASKRAASSKLTLLSQSLKWLWHVYKQTKLQTSRNNNRLFPRPLVPGLAVSTHGCVYVMWHTWWHFLGSCYTSTQLQWQHTRVPCPLCSWAELPGAADLRVPSQVTGLPPLLHTGDATTRLL